MGSRSNCHSGNEVATPSRSEGVTESEAFGLDSDQPISAYFDSAFGWQWWVAALLLVPSLPVMGLAIVLVRCTSRGPGLYRQTRVGLHGRTFQLTKIRTMYVDAEAATGAVWTTSLRDPRITPIGRILRWTHIDELPQLGNVLRGEMALVGPRPERPEFTVVLAQSIPGYLDRLAVLPGVTGLAQVNLPSDSGLESVRNKLAIDLKYLREGSLALDIRIMICTAARVFGLRTVLLRRFLQVAAEDQPNSAAIVNCRAKETLSPEGTQPTQADFTRQIDSSTSGTTFDAGNPFAFEVTQEFDRTLHRSPR